MTKAVACQVVMLSGTVTVLSEVFASLEWGAQGTKVHGPGGYPTSLGLTLICWLHLVVRQPCVCPE